jgi:hypothetical protein
VHKEWGAARRRSDEQKDQQAEARWGSPQVLKDVEYRALTGDVDVCHPFLQSLRGIWG